MLSFSRNSKDKHYRYAHQLCIVTVFVTFILYHCLHQWSNNLYCSCHWRVTNCIYYAIMYYKQLQALFISNLCTCVLATYKSKYIQTALQIKDVIGLVLLYLTELSSFITHTCSIAMIIHFVSRSSEKFTARWHCNSTSATNYYYLLTTHDNRWLFLACEQSVQYYYYLWLNSNTCLFADDYNIATVSLSMLLYSSCLSCMAIFV